MPVSIPAANTITPNRDLKTIMYSSITSECNEYEGELVALVLFRVLSLIYVQERT
jgi:hypothetical protein